jgi:predicted ATPase/transcriptional regulator with XRE-family HTH domain/Tfp pilus assembly protein PilF
MGLTQKELAQLLGYAEVTLRKVEADELRPSSQMAHKLADALQVKPDDRERFILLARDEMDWTQESSPSQSQQHSIRNDSALAPPAVSRPPSSPFSLPFPLTPLIGRSAEIEHLLRLLHHPATRLVTLTGPGGTGKTRVAIEVANIIRQQLELVDPKKGNASGRIQHVFFVNLASVIDPSMVLSAVAQVLGVQVHGDRPLLQLVRDRLLGTRILLVLDNFEHLLDAAPLITDLLVAARGLTVVTTSRRPLRLQSEIEVLVPPLVIVADPVLEGANTVECDAVNLFVERARQVKPDFRLTPENTASVLEICRRLDGLPLAIELAAVRTKVLPPQLLIRHMDRRLPLLTWGSRDLPIRQQTMRNAIAWSYDLLSPDEQKLFCRLTVFAGGCTAFTALQVADPTQEFAFDIIDGLAALVDHSLLLVDVSGEELRFSMLQTLQEFALEQLVASGEDEATRRRYARCYLDLTQAIDPTRRGADLAVEFRRLNKEQDNLRSVLHWALSGGEAAWGAELLTRLSVIWEYFGDLEEGRWWLKKALLASDPLITDSLRSDILISAGALAYRQGDHTSARNMLQQALALQHPVKDASAVACTWLYLGMVAMESADFSAAQESFHVSLAIYRDLQDPIGIAFSIGNLGNVAVLQRNLEEAQHCFEQAQAIFEPTDSQFYLCLIWMSMGWMHVLQGNWLPARQYLGDALSQLTTLGEKRFVLYCVLGLIGVAVGQQQFLRAAQLFGIAEVMRSATHTHVLPLLGMVVDDFGFQVRSVLTASEYSAAFQVGVTMPHAQAIAYATLQPTPPSASQIS